MISRILLRLGAPPLAFCDPVTGALVRATRMSAVRYEHRHPGELIHVAVKKLGKIPDAGGWRPHCRLEKVHGRGIGFDCIHAAIDDHIRLAQAEIHTDEKAATAAGFLLRAGEFFKDRDIGKTEGILTDNAFAYRKSTAFKAAAPQLGAQQRFIQPDCPWTNGKIQCFNRALETEWAYAKPLPATLKEQQQLPPWPNYYNTERIHAAQSHECHQHDGRVQLELVDPGVFFSEVPG